MLSTRGTLTLELSNGARLFQAIEHNISICLVAPKREDQTSPYHNSIYRSTGPNQKASSLNSDSPAQFPSPNNLGLLEILKVVGCFGNDRNDEGNRRFEDVVVVKT
ncbi:hypothetical protein VNO80_07623 [Phaseolus coccineus]|uniref:Uncharacterized protein n=1 Tax=Phaseolus coccineus TaxID=3886 RepID=A0AAN9RIM9_PHACN